MPECSPSFNQMINTAILISYFSRQCCDPIIEGLDGESRFLINSAEEGFYPLVTNCIDNNDNGTDNDNNNNKENYVINQKWSNYTSNRKKILGLYATETHIQYRGLYISYRLDDKAHFFVNNQQYNSTFVDDENTNDAITIKLVLQKKMKNKKSGYVFQFKSNLWKVIIENKKEYARPAGEYIQFQDTILVLNYKNNNDNHNNQNSSSSPYLVSFGGIIGETASWIGKSKQQKQKLIQDMKKNILNYKTNLPFESNDYVQKKCSNNSKILTNNYHKIIKPATLRFTSIQKD